MKKLRIYLIIALLSVSTMVHAQFLGLDSIFISVPNDTCVLIGVIDSTRLSPLSVVTVSVDISPNQGVASTTAGGSVIYCTDSLNINTAVFTYEVCDSVQSPICDSGVVVVYITDPGPVWPGDANNDGIVNNFDVLPIGQTFGFQGIPRPLASDSFYGQFANDWNDTIPGLIDIDQKHADCNGDGFVSYLDTNAISQNYGFTTSKANSNGNPFVDPPLFLEFNRSQLSAFDTLRVNINLGTPQIPAVDVYGLAFSVSYNPALMDTAFESVSFTNSWLLDSVNSFGPVYIVKNFPADNRLDIGVSRIDRINRTGFGLIGHFDVVIEDNIDGKRSAPASFIMNIENVRMISADGTEQPVFAYGDTSQTDIETAIPPIDEFNGITVYPNPANDKVLIQSKQQLDEVKVYSTSGKLLHSFTWNAADQASIEMDISTWTKGIYFLKFQTEKSSSYFKLLKN